MEKVILKNYGGIIVEVTDNLENAIAIIKYVDHGDEFLVVKTEDRIYEYGWFLNRGWYPNYEIITNNLEEYVGENKRFIKAPELYYKMDHNSQASNKIFFYTKDLITWKTKRNEWVRRSHYYDFYDDAQKAFESYIKDIKEVYDGKDLLYGNSYYGHTYHLDSQFYKIVNFLKKHEIYENNISNLNDIK